MFTAIEVIPQEELEARRERCRAVLRKYHPDAGGIMLFSRVNIYYLTGTFASGIFWLPLEGEPVLAVRKGIERAALETPRTKAVTYKSYSQIPALMKEAGSPVTQCFGVEQEGLSWALGQNFSRNFAAYKFMPADQVLDRARSVKTDWELVKVRLAGKRHYLSMCEDFPQRVRHNMNGFEMSRLFWDIFYAHGHTGHARMSELGQEVFLGHVSVGENIAYPSYYNGPLGVKGAHPTAAYMGYAGEVWTKGSFVAADLGFILEGYNSDKTVLYFAGKAKYVPDEARRVQDCCLEIQYEVASGLKPGAVPQELYQLSLGIAAKYGLSEGYMGYAGNQVPFMGHGLGLHVDEWPVLANKFTDPIRENMVIALEPKITIPGYGMMGVENTFIVTPNGAECVSTRTGSLKDDNGSYICIE